MEVDRGHRDVEVFRDLLVRHAGCERVRDLAFAGREVGERIVACRCGRLRAGSAQQVELVGAACQVVGSSEAPEDGRGALEQLDRLWVTAFAREEPPGVQQGHRVREGEMGGRGGLGGEQVGGDRSIRVTFRFEDSALQPGT